MFIAEELRHENLELWASSPRNAVFIEAATGSGKTTFVLDVLVKMAQEKGKEVLFLSNRSLLHAQVRAQVVEAQNLPADFVCDEEEFDGITICSYQKIQKKVKRKNFTCDPSRYAFIVFDEAHYILEDSSFNPEVFWTLVFIKNVEVAKIFISATLKETRNFLVNSGLLGEVLGDLSINSCCVVNTITRKTRLWNEWCVPGYFNDVPVFDPMVWKYEFPMPRRNLKIQYFENIEEIVEIINDSPKKWLIFWENKHKMQEFQKRLHVPSETFSTEDKGNKVANEIIETEHFSTQVLLTTKVLDNGINLRDSDLENIVIDTFSRTEFLQMLGRRRNIQQDERINLYIPKKEKKFFSTYLNCRINPALSVINENISSEVRTDNMLSDPLYYAIVRRYFVMQGNQLCCNPAARFLLEQQRSFCENMLKELEVDEWAFVKEQLRWLDLEDSFSIENSISEKIKAVFFENLKQYLESESKRWLNKSQQEEFRKRVTQLVVQTKLVKVQHDQLLGKNILNKFFEEHGISHRIVSKPGKKTGEESLWEIRKCGEG